MSGATLNVDDCPICGSDMCEHSAEEQGEFKRRQQAGEEQLYQSGDEAQVAKAARTAKAKEKQARADLAMLMQTVQGRRFIWQLLARCGIWRSSFVTSRGSLAGMSFLEGERNVGLELYMRVTTETPAHFATMVKENGA